MTVSGKARLRVFWTGGFFTNASLAIVNRRLVRALIDRNNIDISIGTDAVVPEVLPPEFRSMVGHMTFDESSADLNVVHQWPPRFAVPASSRYVHIQPWEYGSMPTAWYDALHDDCDDVWTHSTYNRQTYLDAGMPADRVAIVPHGVDTNVFRPDGPKMRTSGPAFRFLFVGGTLARKGIDVLINAYGRAFGARDNVVLMIKDVNTTDFYRGLTHGDQIRALARKSNVARLEYIDGMFSDDVMAELFRATDCLVLPYRGEGFGMPVLEAMACGVPVIVTGGGATDDFVDENVGWRIPAKHVDLEPGTAPFPTVGSAWILEPDGDSLARILREVFENRDELRNRSLAAAARARALTWERAASIAEQRLFEIAAREAVPAKRRDRRYRDPHTYEEKVFGTGKLDGIVLEAFRRLGAGRATFVELTQGATIAAACTLARGMRWRGLVAERESQSASAVRYRYQDSPNTKIIFEPFESTAIAELLRAHGFDVELDLLSLGCPDGAAMLEALEPFRPRVITCSTAIQASIGLAAARLGYMHVANDTERSDALFVRSDLAQRVGFEPIESTARLRHA
jgi:glycosyltransferase involved in cell wall biosynthesis